MPGLLALIKTDASLKLIPTFVLTTSAVKESSMNLFGLIVPEWLSLKQYLQIGILPDYRRATYSSDIFVRHSSRDFTMQENLWLTYW